MSGQSVLALECRSATAGWLSMADKDIRLVAEHDELTLLARVADQGAERAAGYQWICPETAEGSAVLFVFPQAMNAAFHMRNVFVPLSIVFFDGHGRKVDVLQMQAEPPGAGVARRYYRPKGAFQYALEVPQDSKIAQFFAHQDIQLQVSE